MKRIIAVMLAVVLVVGGLGGFAYASNTEHPMTGQKLVGSGVFAEWTYPDGTNAKMDTGFLITNPDCVSEITIDRIFVFAYDGTLVYEGPLRVKVDDDYWEVYTGPVKPHETLQTGLEYYDLPELTSEVEMIYTVEILWTWADKKSLPLTGWAWTSQVKRDADTGEAVDIALHDMTQMVNMEQVLEPEKEKVTTLRLQSIFGFDDPLMEPLENFVQAVNNNCDSVRIELYPGGALVNHWMLAEAVKQGTVEMGLIPNAVLAGLSRVMEGGGIPFLYNDDDGLMAAVQAGIGDLLTEEMKAHNITAIDWTDIGIEHLFSRDKMLAHPGDVAGMKIRAHGIQAEAITEWVGTPVMMTLDEVYLALEEEVIDGAILSLHSYDVLNLYEVAPYFCVDYGFAELAGLCINSDVWNSLDKKTREIIEKAAGDYVVEMLATVKDVDTEALQTIEGYGVEVYTLSPEERAVWREASEAVWEDWVQDVGPIGQEIIDIALPLNPLP